MLISENELRSIIREIILEISRRSFLKGAGAAAVASAFPKIALARPESTANFTSTYNGPSPQEIQEEFENKLIQLLISNDYMFASQYTENGTISDKDRKYMLEKDRGNKSNGIGGIDFGRIVGEFIYGIVPDRDPEKVKDLIINKEINFIKKSLKKQFREENPNYRKGRGYNDVSWSFVRSTVSSAISALNDYVENQKKNSRSRNQSPEMKILAASYMLNNSIKGQGDVSLEDAIDIFNKALIEQRDNIDRTLWKGIADPWKEWLNSERDGNQDEVLNRLKAGIEKLLNSARNNSQR